MSSGSRKPNLPSGNADFSNGRSSSDSKKSSHSRPDKNELKGSKKQESAYRRWDQKSSEPVKPTLTIDEQTTRANAIADMDAPDFAPQAFQSKRNYGDDAMLSGGQSHKLNEKQLSAALNGPVEGLISHQLLRQTEHERSELQAKIFSDMRRTMFSL